MEERRHHLPGTAAHAPSLERTEVTRGVAVTTSVVFALGLLAVPLIDGLLGSWQRPLQVASAAFAAVDRELVSDAPLWSRLLAANRAALAGIKNFETSVEDESRLASSVRPRALDALLTMGGAGSEEAYTGKDGWLFYRPDVDAIALHRRSEGRRGLAVATLAADLASHGVRLVIVPVPSKATIHPEQLAAGSGGVMPAVVPGEFAALPAEVDSAWEKVAAARGLDPTLKPLVVDPTPVILEQKQATGRGQFLRTDSHWTPQAMDAVAETLATTVGGVAGLATPGPQPAPAPRKVEGRGDTALMLDLPETSPLLAKEETFLLPVRGADGGPWRPDRGSPVLLLGDSYTNIYSSAELGWGESAGLAEQLSRHLGFTIDRLARSDAGARSAREMLAAEAARDPGWLARKKIVVWQIAARELVNGDWGEVALQVDKPRGEEPFLVAPPGRPVEVTAVIASLGPTPRTGDTPYADYLTAVHFRDLRDATTGKLLAGDALAYVFTMQGRKPLPAATLGAGQKVRARLANYEERARSLDSLNRGELDDVEMMLQTPNFAEWIAPADS